MDRESPIPLWAVVSIGIILVGGVYVLAQRFVAPPQASVIEEQMGLSSPGASATATPSITPSVTPTEKPVATSAQSGGEEWKMYKNEKYGFQFLHPPQTIVESQEAGGTVGLRHPNDFLAELLVYQPSHNEAQKEFFQTVDVYQTSVHDSLRTWFSKNIDFQGQLKETTLHGHDALDVRGGPSDGLGVLNAVFILNKTLIVELDRSGSFVTDEPAPARERLVDSFRFLE